MFVFVAILVVKVRVVTVGVDTEIGHFVVSIYFGAVTIYPWHVNKCARDFRSPWYPRYPLLPSVESAPFQCQLANGVRASLRSNNIRSIILNKNSTSGFVQWNCPLSNSRTCMLTHPRLKTGSYNSTYSVLFGKVLAKNNEKTFSWLLADGCCSFPRGIYHKTELRHQFISRMFRGYYLITFVLLISKLESMPNSAPSFQSGRWNFVTSSSSCSRRHLFATLVVCGKLQ